MKEADTVFVKVQFSSRIDATFMFGIKDPFGRWLLFYLSFLNTKKQKEEEK